MSDQTGLFTRIGRWFRGGSAGNGDELAPDDSQAIQSVKTTRSTFLRPWARRDAAINALQTSFSSLADLMAGIRQNLEDQGRRQDEMLGCLRNLPEVLQSLPESQRVQAETLRAVAAQMEQQSAQQDKLADIMEKVSDAHAGQKEILDSLNQRVGNLDAHDEAISDNLRSVSSALQSVSRHGESSTQVLQTLRDNLEIRGSELERILHRQNTRFTTMLAIAIAFAVAALVAVCIIGYLMLTRGH